MGLSVRTIASVLLVGMMVGVMACSAPAAHDFASGGGGSAPPAAPQPAPGVPGAPKVTSEAAADRSAAPAGGQTAANGGVTPANPDRMIVYNTQVQLTVESVLDSVGAIGGLAEGAGGFVSASNSRVQGDRDYATITIRVPARGYNQVMAQLRKMAVKVTGENGSASDVTEEFADLGAQVRNLQASELQLQTLMAQAKTVDEILKVQSQLTNVRGQIERLQGRVNVLQRTADMATITVTLSPVTVATTDPVRGFDPARSISEAWASSVRVAVVFIDAGLRLAVFSWVLIPPGLLLWAAVALALRLGRRSAPARTESGAS